MSRKYVETEGGLRISRSIRSGDIPTSLSDLTWRQRCAPTPFESRLIAAHKGRHHDWTDTMDAREFFGRWLKTMATVGVLVSGVYLAIQQLTDVSQNNHQTTTEQVQPSE